MKILIFSNAYKIVDKEKDLKEMMTKEEKKSLAIKRKELREITHIIQNHLQKSGQQLKLFLREEKQMV